MKPCYHRGKYEAHRLKNTAIVQHLSTDTEMNKARSDGQQGHP